MTIMYVYVKPPLREWGIAALGEACGRKFQPGGCKSWNGQWWIGVGEWWWWWESKRNFDPAIITALRVSLTSDEGITDLRRGMEGGEWVKLWGIWWRCIREGERITEWSPFAFVAAQKALGLELLVSMAMTTSISFLFLYNIYTIVMEYPKRICSVMQGKEQMYGDTPPWSKPQYWECNRVTVN